MPEAALERQTRSSVSKPFVPSNGRAKRVDSGAAGRVLGIALGSRAAKYTRVPITRRD